MSKLNTDSNGYTLFFLAIMVMVVGGALAFISSALQPTIDANQELDRRKKVKKAIKLVTSNDDLLEDNPILKNTLKVRNTYLDPLSLIQILLMKKLSDKEITEEEKTALLLTVNGLAAGLRNTG